MEAWQRCKRLLDAFQKQDHKPEVTCQVNGFGYITWHCQILDKKHVKVWKTTTSWDTWEAVETILIEWLTKTYDAVLPMELCNFTQNMRSLPGVPTIETGEEFHEYE